MTGTGRLSAAVALGSALGAVSRYLVSVGLLAALGPGFPWGTLAVNVAGSFLIGFYDALSGPDGPLAAGAAQRHLVMTGFCGGFTTFSIFSLETLRLYEAGAVGLAAGNLGLSVVSWLVAVALGWRAGVALGRRRA